VAAGAVEMDTEFATFWTAYPHKVCELTARSAFAAARRKTTLAKLLAGAARYTELLYRSGAPYPMNPARWLRLERWRDQRFPAPETNHRLTVFAETGSNSYVGDYPITSRSRRQSASEAYTAACRDVCLAMGGQDIWRNYPKTGSGMAAAAAQ
jgi:hypothetical protein